MKKIFKEAHEMTRELVKKYKVNYQAQFSLCLSYLLNKEEGKMEGTEKQIEYANIIKERMVGELKLSKMVLHQIGYKSLLKQFKEPLVREYGKGVKIGIAKEAVKRYIDTAIKNIREEKSAKKLIEIYNAPMYAEKTVYEAIVKYFI